MFEGFRTLPGTHKIKLKPDAVAVIHPHAESQCTYWQTRKRIKENGRSWRQSQSKRANWLGELNCNTKKQRTGALRVCLDSRDLNQAIKREHYPLPTLEDLTLLLSDVKYFSVRDATLAYWHITLDAWWELVVNHLQHAVWAVLLYQNALRSSLISGGIPETMDMRFEGINGCESIIDDMLTKDHPKGIMTRIWREF